MVRGNCFEVHARAMLLTREEDGLVLVHGLPVGTAGVPKGKRFWHAWTETEILGTWYVMDYANGRQIVAVRDEYYAKGQLDEDHVWRYTRQETLKHMTDTEQFGPWVPDWQDLEEIG